jgi:hypothetical protein
MAQTSFPGKAELGPFKRWPSVWVGLAIIIGVLAEVQVMLSLVAFAKRTLVSL